MELFLFTVIIFVILGVLVGIISSIAGVGGGVLYVPILSLIFLMPINQAIDTSTFVILISSASGFLSYLKDKRTNVKLALIFAAFSILGSLLSTLLFLFITLNDSILRFLFASLLIFAGLNMIRRAYQTRKKNKSLEGNKAEPLEFSLTEHDYKSNLKRGIPLFILGGFTANLLGIGGGVIYTPALNLIIGYPIHNSTAISTSMIFFTAIFNVIAKSITGQIDYLVGIFLGIGSIFGAYVGSKASNRMPRAILQSFVAIVLIGVAIRMYL
jgi:hypothetical protein